MHIAVDTLGNLLALKVTAANEQERAQVGELAEKVQEVTGANVEVAFVDQGYTGEEPADERPTKASNLKVVKHTEAKKRIRAAAATLGGRTHLRMARTLPSPGPRLRTTHRNARGWHWLAFLALLLGQLKFTSA